MLLGMKRWRILVRRQMARGFSFETACDIAETDALVRDIQRTRRRTEKIDANIARMRQEQERLQEAEEPVNVEWKECDA